ncbi:hypothetical protein HP567_003590 [Brevibacillus sp. M2.1A]|uniref:hypothetical protein n=1 Tax=Brevibacillus TaxID=55080 RepID=UPI00156B2550|nr:MULTISPECIES: hypothetical protein [Brevibacillus]MBY0089204.1 hypothetical protein [Brevibacillus brevis]MCC8433667.1 hypothetical protein [Brevibacillus sp. M2.1A]MCE0453671.1 hypothetical protein [Brevibacillus sp. AF8]
MNKMISILAVMAIILPLTVGLLLTGPQNLFSACTQFFGDLLAEVTRFGTG